MKPAVNGLLQHSRYEYRGYIHGTEQFTILMPSAFRISMRKSIDHKLLCWRDDVISNEDYSTESGTAAEKTDSIRDQKNGIRAEQNPTWRLLIYIRRGPLYISVVDIQDIMVSAFKQVGRVGNGTS